MHKVVERPLYTRAAAVYPWCGMLAKRFTAVSRFDDEYVLFRKFTEDEEERIAVPRNCAPLGEDKRVVGQVVKYESRFKARNEEQLRVVNESAARIIKGRNFITEAPTGFGKTWVAMEVISRVKLKTLVVVVKEDLKDQWIKAAKEVLGLHDSEIGVVQGSKTDVENKKLVIGMIQSLAKQEINTDIFDDVGLTVWDEVHRAAADYFSNTCWVLPSKRRWGLSATPERVDGKEDLLYANIGRTEVISDSMTLIPNVYRVVSKTRLPDVQGRPTETGFLEKLLYRDPRRNYFIARFVKRAWSLGRNTIVFASTKKHLEFLHEAMVKAGIPDKDLAYYVGGLSKSKREESKKARVILATYAFTAEATDIPRLDTAVMATPRANVVQIIGRVLRKHPNKPQPVVLDIVDNIGMYWGFYKKRLAWYHSIGAKVKGLSYE